MSRARRGTRTRRTAAAVLAALALGVLGAPAASAHDSLVSSTPADGASLPAPPTSVDLVLSEPAQALGTQVSVTGPDGQEHAAGAVQLVDATVTQPLDGDLPAGDYAVVWRVTSSDGHPISGELGFTVATGAAAPEPTPSAGSEPEMTTQGGAGSADDADPAPSDSEDGAPVSRAMSAVLALVALGAVVALFVLARRRQPPQD